MANRRDIQFTYNPHNKATVLDCSFVVDSTNGNGFGIRSLKKSGRISSVFMNTSAAFTGTTHTSTSVTGIASGTANLKVGMRVSGSGITAGTVIASIVDSGSITLSAATSSSTTTSISYFGIATNGLVNPNPAAGYIAVTLQDNYNVYLGGYAGFVSPLSGTPISISTGSSLTAGVVYVIVSVGTTTQAQWQAVGLPSYVKAAVGVSFVASATSGSGTGAVESTVSAGVDHIEVIGDANLMNSTGANVQGFGVGMTVLMACYKNTALTAPTAGSVIGLNFYLNDTNQGV